MTDIVFRLRMVDPNQVLLMEPPFDTRYLHAGLLCHQAASEIERLRAENKRLRFECGALVKERMTRAACDLARDIAARAP